MADARMSVKSNLSENERTKLTDEELLSQMHKDPDIQKRLREEIRERERQINIEGRSHNGFTAEDFDGMPYLNAVVKVGLESLVFHSVTHP
ncbi:hypothetical protein AAF712_007275 [Marasmius tenuissimus]|uniref:Uncharacterized protein n=1 Tax=Marasmius tenuissimus TaxID=585030 RepID=A0ABR2ZZQ3_9AGAR